MPAEGVSPSGEFYIRTFDVLPFWEEIRKEFEAVYKGSSFFFDFETVIFRLDGGGKMTAASGYDAWKQWCIKTVARSGGAFDHYTDGLGAEYEGGHGPAHPGASAAQPETAVTEALLADPYGRTMEVRDFVWSRGVDSLHMSCTVVGQDDRTARIERDIPGREQCSMAKM